MTNALSTDRQILALRPRDKPYEVGVALSRGLTVRVFPTGAKYFELRYTTAGGARRRLSLGGYPDLSLAQARIKAGALRVEVVEGGDPAGDRAAARERARSGETFDELAEAYWRAATKGLHGGRRRPKRQSTIDTERHWWRNHIQKPLGSRRFHEIRRADIRTFMRNLATDSGLAPSSVASVGALIHAVLGFAVHEDRLEANPATGLARPLALTSRDRMFSDDALATIWRAAVVASTPRQADQPSEDIHARLAPETGLAIRMLMLSLTRRTEVAGARWSEFDMAANLWIIPASRAKARHLHVVPLTPDLREVLHLARALNPGEDVVFPALKGGGDHLDPHAMTRAFARICRRHALPPGSPHDVRRSGATTLVGRYGISRLVVGMLLGHTSREGAAVTSVYDRHTYIPEKRHALAVWGEHLRALRVDASLRLSAESEPDPHP